MAIRAAEAFRTEDFMDQVPGNAVFLDAVWASDIRSGSKDRSSARSFAFLASGVSGGLLLALIFENNIQGSLWPSGTGNELALVIACFSLFVAAAFLLIAKWRRIADVELICAGLASSDGPFQVVVRKTADMSEVATALNSARQAFEKAALLRAAIEGQDAFELTQKFMRERSFDHREFRIPRQDDGGCRIISLASQTKASRSKLQRNDLPLLSSSI